MSSELENNNNPSGADQTINRRKLLLGTSSIVAAATLTSEALAQAQKAAPGAAASPAASSGSGRKPNILVIFGDDIGQTNVSAYTFGMMGYRTPNIDRIAKEGMMFTDYYAEQSCTAGRVVLHHRPMHAPHRPVQGGHCPAPLSACRRETRRSPSC